MPAPNDAPTPELPEERIEGGFAAALDRAAFAPLTASISPQILSKVTRLFNGGLEDIIHECFQNARRAEATEVEVFLTRRGTLCLQDNGNGIESPDPLLNLGQSNWEREVVESEDPAGMGFFSLANRGVTIASQNWQVHLEPEHFTGAAAAIVYAAPVRVGTGIEFPVSDPELRSLESVIAHASRYYPLSVRLNGTSMSQQEFLDDAIVVKSWRGLQLGVSAHHRWAERSGVGALNFYGLTVAARLPTLLCNDTTLRVRVDVESAPELKLVLPQRKEVVQNEFFQALTTELRRTLYEVVATFEHHDLPYVRWLEARSFGIHLPPARSHLSLFCPAIADLLSGSPWQPSQSVDHTSVLVDVQDLEAPDQQIFARALSKGDLPYTLMAPADGYRGYAWYDCLPQLRLQAIEIEVDGQVLSPEEFGQTYAQSLQVRVDAITAIVGQSQADQPDIEHRLPLDVAFGELDQCSYSPLIDEVTLVIAQHHPVDPSDLSELLEASFFSPSEEHEADSYDTQRDDFREAAQERVIQALYSEAEALKARIEMVVDRHLRWVVPSTMKIEVRVSPIATDANSEQPPFNRSVQVEVITSE